MKRQTDTLNRPSTHESLRKVTATFQTIDETVFFNKTSKTYKKVALIFLKV